MSIHRGVRIGFTGAGGTGKTTSAEYIAKELNLPTFKSASRLVYESKGLTEEKVFNEFSNNQKLALQMEIFETKIKLDNAFSYVTDRTLLDHYAYCLAYCGGFMTNEQFQKFDEKVQIAMRSTYTHIFYFPWGFWFNPPDKGQGDRVRRDLMSWQSQIDSIILGHLNRWSIPAIVVPQTQGPEVRNKFIKKMILGEEQN